MKKVKVLGLVLVLMLAVGALAACGSSDKPEDKVKSTIEDFAGKVKTGDLAAAAKLTVKGSDKEKFLVNEKDIAGGLSSKDVAAVMLSNLKVDIKEVKVDGDKATAKVDVTNKDMTAVFTGLIQKISQESQKNPKLQNDEKAAAKLMMDVLKEETKGAKEKTTKDVELTLEKDGEDWKIKFDTKFQNALLGGFDGSSLGL